MIKFSMPLSMGKVTKINPYTGEGDIEHPFLEVGSSFCNLKPEIEEWLNNTFEKWKFDFDGIQHCLYFDTEKNLMLFKLRWS